MKTTTSCPWKSKCCEGLNHLIPTFLCSIDILDPLFIDAFLHGQEVVIFIVCSLLRLRGYRHGRERTMQ